MTDTREASILPRYAPPAPEPDAPSGYWPRFRARCAAWGEKFPELYAELVKAARANCDVPESLPQEKIRPAVWRVVEAQVNEEIRRRQNWPDELAYNNRVALGLDPSTAEPQPAKEVA